MRHGDQRGKLAPAARCLDQAPVAAGAQLALDGRCDRQMWPGHRRFVRGFRETQAPFQSLGAGPHIAVSRYRLMLSHEAFRVYEDIERLPVSAQVSQCEGIALPEVRAL